MLAKATLVVHQYIMILTNEELKIRAKKFSREWKDAHYERGETQSFYNDFFQIFNVTRRRVAVYEKSVKKLGNRQGFVDLFWARTLIVEQKSAGRDLLAAENQALDYTHGLKNDEVPRYILACDFQTWRLTDLELNETVTFTLPQLAENIHHFAFILGRQRTKFKDQDPVNIKASELIGHLHDALEASGYTGHDLERFLVRIVFCLFADDTGIFEPKDILWDFLETQTKPDGSETGPKLQKIFDVLDQHPDKRSPHLAEEYAQFPHVNGALFADPIRIPDFDEDMHAALLNACRFDWTPISPAIFGSLFQSVMNAKERREKGAHYTTEKNIMKVIEPLFLDDLRSELRKIKGLRTGRRKRLEAFQSKLSKLTFFDPACGCGNFLIIAYRELRLLELEVMQAIKDMGQLALLQSVIDVDQFFGIEYEEFPARIAETALWMMDHIMNRQLSDRFGELFVRIPLEKKAKILHDDALEIDWNEVLPAKGCSFILGNPPFIGAKYQSPFQREQVRRIANLGKSGGTLDYVSAWFIKAGEYATGNTRIAFVTTNSITQGEQVAQLWPILFDRCKLEISFAHRTFAWGSEARGKAQVHVVIVGLDLAKNKPTQALLFSYDDIQGEPTETRHKYLSPYLFDAAGLRDPHLVCAESSSPINGLSPITIGSKPIDGGYYIFSKEEMNHFVSMEPASEHLFRPYIGSQEFLNGGERYILFTGNSEPSELANLPRVRDIITQVRKYRLGELPKKGKPIETAKPLSDSSIHLAETPNKFHVTRVPTEPFLVFPETTSVKRKYAPIGWLEPPAMPSNLVKISMTPSRSDFGILSSKMHFSWLWYVGGKMKSDPRYSIGLVYNTFPLPKGDLSKLEPLAQRVLDARANHPNASLANLYDPDLMPTDLRNAHIALDRAVDKLYRRTEFASDRERAEHLFQLYEAMVRPLLSQQKRRAKPKGTVNDI